MPALHLDEWEISLTRHPQYTKFRPFLGWISAQPTKSLDWYDAYNRTKHDRENHLADATLERLIYACGAAYVMVMAQFGQFGFKGKRVTEIDLFQVERPPVYSLEEHYVPPGIAQDKTWVPCQLPL